MFKWIYDGTLTNLLAPSDTSDTGTLIDAASKGSISVLEDFYKKGVDVLSFTRDNNFLIHVAAYNGQLETFKWFLEKGDNINKLGRNNNTPLHYACSQNRVEVAEYILTHGGNPHASNTQNKTAYDLVADTHFSLKQMLLKYMYQTPEGQALQPQTQDVLPGFTKAEEEKEVPPPPPPPPSLGAQTNPSIPPTSSSSSSMPTNNVQVFFHPALARHNTKSTGINRSHFKPIPTSAISSAQSESSELEDPNNNPIESLSSPLHPQNDQSINPSTISKPSHNSNPHPSNPLLIPRNRSTSSHTSTTSVSPTTQPLPSQQHNTPTFGLANKGPRRQINYTRYIPGSNKSQKSQSTSSVSPTSLPSPAQIPTTISESSSMNQPAIISVSSSSTISNMDDVQTTHHPQDSISPLVSSPSAANGLLNTNRSSVNRPKPKTRTTSRLMADGFITTVGNPELARKYGNYEATASDSLPPPPK